MKLKIPPYPYITESYSLRNVMSSFNLKQKIPLQIEMWGSSCPSFWRVLLLLYHSLPLTQKEGQDIWNIWLENFVGYVTTGNIIALFYLDSAIPKHRNSESVLIAKLHFLSHQTNYLSSWLRFVMWLWIKQPAMKLTHCFTTFAKIILEYITTELTRNARFMFCYHSLF